MSEPLAAGEDRSGGLGVSGIRGSNSVVESQPSKLLVAGSIPVSRSNLGGDRRYLVFLESRFLDVAGPMISKPM